MAKNYFLLLIVLISVSAALLFYDNPSPSEEDILFQVSTFKDLSAGHYEGIISSGNLKMHGDVGIGTFDGLDGEMIELNGYIYQAKSDRSVLLANNSDMIPFAMVTDFNPDKILVVNKSMNYKELQQYLNTTIPSKNLFYSFKVMGSFSSIKARSPPKQHEPYPNLTDALKNQSIFYFNNINGTMVGFWCPESARSVNLNDYHFHFISVDRNSGGHVLDVELDNVIIEIDYMPNIYVFSPSKNN